MRLHVRVAKKQVRIVAVAALVLAMGAGAGVTAQTPGAPDLAAPPAASNKAADAGPASVSRVSTVPYDESIPFAPHPEEQLEAVQAGQEQQGEQGQAEGQQGEQTEQQQGEPPQQEQTVEQAPPPAIEQDDLLSPQEREALALVEEIIREQEGILMGTSFDYQTGGRRDPFRSLVPTSSVAAPTVRPFGLPGFLISEVDLKAIATARGNWHAMVVGPNQRAYFLEVGTQLYDGHVVEIRPGEVVFEQQVPDLMGARRIRMVTKRLRTTESGGGQTP